MQQTMEKATVKHSVGAYAYDYDALPPLAMQKGLPREELPSGAWIRDVLHVVMAVASDQHEANIEPADIAALGAQLAHPSTNDFIDLIRTFWRRLNGASPTSRPQTLDDYRDQFRTIPLPPPTNVLHDDDAFAWWRVAWTNPTAIQRPADPRPLINDGVRSVAAFADDDLDYPAAVSGARNS